MTTSATTSAATYTIDADHSSVEFAVKHLMVASTRGRFRDFEGTLRLDEANPTRSEVEAVIRAASVDTGLEMRDNDLRSDNFFDADRFPEIRFRSTRVEAAPNDRWLVHGDLTIREVTREVILDTEIEGRGVGFQGEDHIGFTATTTIDRKEFGLLYNAVLETGSLVVADRVRITLNIEAVRAG